MSEQLSSLVTNPEYKDVQDNTLRFSQAAWFNYVQQCRILVAGVGGIGSWLAFMLARLNPRDITLIDPDYVERVNMAGQLFRTSDIGNTKVSAVDNIIQCYCDYHRVNLCLRRLELNDSVPRIVFGGFDNMEARKILYNCWKKTVIHSSDRNKCLLIDGRLSAEIAQVFCISGEDDYYMEQYEKNWLFDDSQAESVVCSYKQTSYCANLIASLMTNLFVNWCTNHCSPIMDRALPFMTEYLAEQMFLKEVV